MTAPAQKTVLRTGEKRFLVGVGVVFFIVLNIWLVFPYFGAWKKAQDRYDTAEKKLHRWQEEVNRIPNYKKEIARLQGDSAPLQGDEMVYTFQTTIQSQAAQSHVNIQNTSRVNTSTNSPFFLEQFQTLQILSGEKELVDFLYQLGAGTSLIRVRDLTLRPDLPRQQLSAGVKLVASYQRKQPTKAASPAAGQTAAATKNRP